MRNNLIQPQVFFTIFFIKYGALITPSMIVIKTPVLISIELLVILRKQTPTPSKKPVTTLIVLLLSRNLRFCEVQSSIDGKVNRKESIKPSSKGTKEGIELVKTKSTIFKDVKPITIPEHRAHKCTSLLNTRNVIQCL